MPTITEALTESAAEYAQKLVDAGFTVYVMEVPDRGLSHWFHYSREVDGQTCYGIYYDHGTLLLEPPSHSMPITPSRLNGSSATIGGAWGDDATLNIDNMDPRSVEYAEAVARPVNWCPYCATPTPELDKHAYRNGGAPRSAHNGARLRNAKPWGIGTRYVPAEVAR